MKSLKELLDKISSYNPKTNRSLILKAYIFSKNGHGSQKRHSGELYFVHPVAVAIILADLKVDDDTIIAALLHDVVEDTEINLSEIEQEFGENVRNLVDGVTALSKLSNYSANDRIAENFRKLAMAMSEDIRVLLIKLADRLHNLRTIQFVPSKDKRIAKAKESLDIYAPLAARIGLNKVKDEIQDLAFQVIDPDARNFISGKLNELIDARQDFIDKIIEHLDETLKSEDIRFKIMGRQKTYYSIWSKMKEKNAGFHHLHDIMAFRIIVDDIPTCYRALGVINSQYSMIPKTFRDYISTPKENGYRSLHLGTLGPFNKKIEIQIRDFQMHDEAELGLAAHWFYKDSGCTNPSPKFDEIRVQAKHYRWIRDLISLFDNSTSAKEAMDNNKLHLHKDEVFCFTPNGDIFNLPMNSTALDFAYTIHSEIGNSCVSAKINGVTSPLRQELENGDQIEIVTRKNSTPSSNWLQFVTTAKARSTIKAFIREEKFKEQKKLGFLLINKFFLTKNKNFSEDLMEKILPKLNLNDTDELYVKISEGLIIRKKIFELAYPDEIDLVNKPSVILSKIDRSNKSVAIDGVLSGMSITFAYCCNPIPGDIIVGIINTGTGVTVHNQECSNLKNLIIKPQRIIEVHWKDTGKSKILYSSRLRLLIGNKVGYLAKITTIIAKKKINITNMRVSQKSEDFCELLIDIAVENKENIESILSSLIMTKSVVNKAERVN